MLTVGISRPVYMTGDRKKSGGPVIFKSRLGMFWECPHRVAWPQRLARRSWTPALTEGWSMRTIRRAVAVRVNWVLTTPLGRVSAHFMMSRSLSQ